MGVVDESAEVVEGCEGEGERRLGSREERIFGAEGGERTVDYSKSIDYRNIEGGVVASSRDKKEGGRGKEWKGRTRKD